MMDGIERLIEIRQKGARSIYRTSKRNEENLRFRCV